MLKNCLKLLKNHLNTIFFVFINFSKSFCEYIRMEKQTIRMKLLREKYLDNMLNNPFLKAKNGLLELEKDFMELKDRELNDREEKLRDGRFNL